MDADISEVQIPFCIQRYKMDVGMRYFHTEYSHAYPFAGHGGPYSGSHLTGEKHQLRIKRLVQIKEIIDLLLGDDQSMSLLQRIDIQKRVAVLRLGHLACRKESPR